MKKYIKSLAIVLLAVVSAGICNGQAFEPHLGIYENSNYPTKYYGYYGCENDIYYFVALCSYPDGQEIDSLPCVLIDHPDKNGYTGTFTIPDSVTYRCYKKENGKEFYDQMSDKTQRTAITGLGDGLKNSCITNLILNNHIKNIYRDELNTRSGGNCLDTITLASNNDVVFNPHSFNNSSVHIIKKKPDVNSGIIFMENAWMRSYSTMLDCSECGRVYFSSYSFDGNLLHLVMPSDALLEEYALGSAGLLSLKVVGSQRNEKDTLALFNQPLYKDNAIFYYGSSNPQIILDFDVPPTRPLAFNNILDGILRSIGLFVPDKSVELYKKDDVWKKFNIIPKSQYHNGTRDIVSDREVKSIEKYDINGRRLQDAECNGVIIERINYNDGTTQVIKKISNTEN
ncbi:MAG: hypothetical protein J6J42_12820 [Lachnospiraceae bacterium]|nr:hypothetical protein [Muribaculaceae bacterium]MBP3611204.1 hypothetical protein [Lachnospiraceae bacterium]